MLSGHSANAPRPLHHAGPCGERRLCWRPACRDTFSSYKTVEVMPNGWVISHCHGQSYSASDLDLRVELSKHGVETVTS